MVRKTLRTSKRTKNEIEERKTRYCGYSLLEKFGDEPERRLQNNMIGGDDFFCYIMLA